MNNKKYKLSNITMKFEGRRLYRIRALRDFSDVDAGELGGWVESENNLSQEGDCWIYDNAKCVDNARMYDNSTIYNNSEMHHNARMYDNSTIYDDGKMYDNARMYDNSTMYKNSIMCSSSRMYDNSRMCNNSILKGNDKLYGKLVSRVEEFIEINNKKGRIVTGVLKDGKILYNIGCQNEITKEVFIDRIYNEGGGVKKHPYRKEYLKIIDIIEAYFSK